MKYILSKLGIALAFILMNNVSTAQNTPQIVSTVQAGVAASLIDDGKIVVDGNSEISSFMFKIGIVRRADAVDTPFEIKGILIIESNGADHIISDEITFKGGDFIPAWSINSSAKDYLVTLTKPNKIGAIKFKYSEKVNNIWGAYLKSNLLANTKSATVQPPLTTFSGPNQTCSEGTYTITNPGTITLENASGIATLTALGNEQWKVSKIGDAYGNVILRSTKNNVVTDFSIRINSNILSGIINGPVQFNRTESNVNFSFEYSSTFDSGPVSWSVNNSNIAITDLGNNTISLTVLPSFNFPTGQNIANLQITASKQTECGIATSVTTVRLRK